MNLEDWVILGLVNSILGVATIYLYLHPSDTNFLSWCGLVTTVTGVYHWISYRDDKVPDAQ